MTSVERSNKRADAVTNRTRLLDAALIVFAQSGLDLEVHDIAAQAQVGVGTLYRHFGNREDLLRSIVTHVVDDTLAQMRLAIQPYSDDPRSALQALVAAGLRVQQEYQSIFFVVRDPRLTRLFPREQREAMRASLVDLAQGVVERGIQMEIFRKDLDSRMVAATIFGSFGGVFENLNKHYALAEMEQQLFQLLWTMIAREQAADKERPAL